MSSVPFLCANVTRHLLPPLWRAFEMGAALSSGDPAPDGLAQKLLKIQDLRRQGGLTADESDSVVKLLLREFSMPALPLRSTGANGAIVATATPADASAPASSVGPAGDGRSPLGDSSDCGLHGTSVPLDGAAMGTPRSLCDDVGMCLALPSKEGHPMGAPFTAALTDDGGRPPDLRANEGPVPGAMTWDRRLSESSSRLASIVAHRKGNSSAHDSIMCRGGPTGSAACCRRQCSRSASGRGLTPTAPATQPTGAASFLGTCRWCCRHFVALAQAKAGPLLRGRRVLRVR